MGIVFEVIMEILLEVFDWQENKKKRNKWIYYPLIILNRLLFLLIALGLMIVGIIFMIDNEIYGVLFLGLGISFIVGWTYKYRGKRGKR